MAKIVVADDNSNIQKMVGLALKDQGIEVFAVGNGEAAVRKISDVRPDLVLADVFMPVRNGYEVCQYVKDDPSLSHIPVILLVGAFDPLDEQEAQRVRADGVLKKPFVPPDPLIAMVKSALQRAGVAVPGSAAERAATPPPPQTRPTDFPASKSPYAASAKPAELPSSPQQFAMEQESFVDETPAPPAPVTFDSEKQHFAFENLLGAAPTAETEPPASFVPGELPPVRDWRDSAGAFDEPEEEREEEESPAGGWRAEIPGVEFSDGQSAGETAGHASDWQNTPFEIPNRKSLGEVHAHEEKNGLTDAATLEEATEVMASESPAEVSSEAGIETSTEIQFGSSKNVPVDAPIEKIVSESFPPTTIPISGEAWATAIATGDEEPALLKDTASSQQAATRSKLFSSEEFTSEELTSDHLIPGRLGTDNPYPEPDSAQHIEHLTSAHLEPGPVNAGPVNAENHIAEHPDTQVEDSWIGLGHGSEAAKTEEQIPAIILSQPSVNAWDAHQHNTLSPTPSWDAPTPNVTLEHGAAPADTSAVESKIHIEHGSAISNLSQGAGVPGETNMDDLVAKVLARMTPEAMQAVTREILKPVVEALLRDELKPKS
ncbi:MAG: hypothetical protein NVS9B4_27180 [Candidatus Acidiferrum sp.]